ncbi:RHS repeat-associated core domain-containing protein [Thiorhodococcus drewsii]|uniref:RHS repeat-associated core domain-containing protein n=1 Tax=Thiorhodococcus drewsii TaxID=210408 RepID=UPI000595043A|nr:RHS repeat-associated core domain-containing protein [Thiorhodococcus drewsii]
MESTSTPDTTNSARANLSFGQAIAAWNAHDYQTAYGLFRSHVEDYPYSPWSVEANLHMGCESRYLGRYSEAEQHYQGILDTLKGMADPAGRKLLSKATLRLGVLKTLQNNFEAAGEQFHKLYAEGVDWRDRTYASHWMQRLSRYKADEMALLDCGTRALAYMLRRSGKGEAAEQVLKQRPTSRQGHSMEELRVLAGRHGYTLEGFELSGANLAQAPLPLIAQIQGREQGDRGHYWIVEGFDEGRLALHDPQSRRRFTQTLEQFTREWRGAVLMFVPDESDLRTLPGRRLAQTELEGLTGGCCGVPRPEAGLGHDENAIDTDLKETSGSPNVCAVGEPSWLVNLVNLNLFVHDTPLWYRPAIGPEVSIGLSYNSQSANNYLEPFGNKWQFNYASFLVLDPGNTVTVRMPDGSVEEYSQDAEGNFQAPPGVYAQLSHVLAHRYQLRFPDGTVYFYNIPAGTNSEQPFLISITDRQGHAIEFGYDATPRLTTITDADGQVTRLVYGADGRVATVTDPFGRSANFSYDAEGNLVRIVDMGGIATEMAYDPDSYISGIDYGEGWWDIAIEPADDVSTDNPYPAPGADMDEDYRITITGPDGGKEEYYYNGYSKYSWYVAPEDYVEYENSSINNFRTAKKTRYDFTEVNGVGVLRQKTSPEGRVEYYYYDSDGNRTGIRDANGNQYSFEYNANGYLTLLGLPNGQTIDLTYDPSGEDLVSILSGLGPVTLEYDANGNVTAILDRKGNRTDITYNADGQVTAVTDPTGVATTYLYDAGRRLESVLRSDDVVAQFSYDAKGRVRTARDADGLTLTYDYDDLDRITRIQYPDGRDIALSWSSVRPTQLDAQSGRGGQTQGFDYDLRQNLTLEVNAEGGRYRYQYDGNNNLRFFTDANGNTTSFDYDDDNRLTARQYADGSAETYVYDNGGRLRYRTNARGIRTSYSYDANGNLLRINYGDSTPDVRLAYDEQDRLVSRIDALGTFGYTYDANSNLTSVDGPWDGDTIIYRYDSLDRRTQMVPEGGSSLGYLYDSLKHLTGISVGGRVYRLGYSAAGNALLSLTRPSGVVTRYLNDALGRLLEVSNETAGGDPIDRFEYTYNGQDMRDSEIVTNIPALPAVDSQVTVYDYNALNQLLATSSPDRVFQYDADGNMVGGYTREGLPFVATYDAENRLTTLEYTDAAGVLRETRYVYGADSLVGIVQKYRDGRLEEEKRFVRDGFLVIQERDATNQLERQYAWRDHGMGGIGRLLSLDQNGQTYDYLFDGKGNVSALVDQSGRVSGAYRYDTFGSLISVTGGLDQPMRFSTKYYDEETGLSDFGFRFYSAVFGRWVNRDPIGIAGGSNLYEFVADNPVNYFDPRGLMNPFKWFGSFTVSVLDHYSRNTKMEPGPSNLKDFLCNKELASRFDFYGSTPTHNLKNNFNLDFRGRPGSLFEGYQWIYNVNGSYVSNVRDGGSFDFVSPSRSKSGHAISDAMPWVIMGNSPSDMPVFGFGDRFGALLDTAVEGHYFGKYHPVPINVHPSFCGCE